jgi:hypothetical protein
MTFINSMGDTSSKYDLTSQILFGIVVNNDDPLRQQRLQIRISLLHQGYPDASLPWVLPIQSYNQGSAPGIGQVNVPVNGSKIAVYFPENDAVNTYYMGSTVVGTSVVADFTTNYPNAYGWVDSAGNMFKVDTVAMTWTWNMVDGSYIQFSSGTLNIVASNTLNVLINGNATINIEGTGTIAAAGPLNLFGNPLNLNQGAAPSSTLQPIPRAKPPVTDFTGQTKY